MFFCKNLFDVQFYFIPWQNIIKSRIVYDKIRFLPMCKGCILYNVYHLYADGFRNMTIGKVLWTVIIIKLFIIFFVLKLFFFPDVLKQKAKGGDKASYVAGELISR